MHKFTLLIMLSALSAIVALTACGGGSEAQARTPTALTRPYPPGLTDATITVNSVVRQYRVHVPVSLTSAPKGIVVVLHGGGGEGLGVADTGAHPLSVFRTVADREGFVVVYPGGLPARDGSAGWTDCRADNLLASGSDDVGFLAALIEFVRSQYSLPTSRVFMAGGSNGAMMTQAFALARPDLVAAVASSSGGLALNPRPGACAIGPIQPMPILLVNGTADPQVPFEGGCVANIGGACSRGKVIPAITARDRWLQANGLASVMPVQEIIDADKTDGGPANRFDYAGATPLQWWRMDGGGHTMASRTVLVTPNPVTGFQDRDVEFAEIAWAFFAAQLR